MHTTCRSRKKYQTVNAQHSAHIRTTTTTPIVSQSIPHHEHEAKRDDVRPNPAPTDNTTRPTMQAPTNSAGGMMGMGIMQGGGGTMQMSGNGTGAMGGTGGMDPAGMGGMTVAGPAGVSRVLGQRATQEAAEEEEEEGEGAVRPPGSRRFAGECPGTGNKKRKSLNVAVLLPCFSCRCRKARAARWVRYPKPGNDRQREGKKGGNVLVYACLP
ncbi:hypothetical protein BC835DRAFT_779429 [Cytidiella melzeri]|nr:hypothetical protein BC835DRAFT_779429 [Cytidiella melzeri]